MAKLRPLREYTNMTVRIYVTFQIPASRSYAMTISLVTFAYRVIDGLN